MHTHTLTLTNTHTTDKKACTHLVAVAVASTFSRAYYNMLFDQCLHFASLFRRMGDAPSLSAYSLTTVLFFPSFFLPLLPLHFFFSCRSKTHSRCYLPLIAADRSSKICGESGVREWCEELEEIWVISWLHKF